MKSRPKVRRLKAVLLRKPTPSKLLKLCYVLTPFVMAVVIFFWKFRSMGLSHWDEYYFLATSAAMSAGSGPWYAYDPPLFSLFLYLMFQRFGFSDYVAVATSGIIALVLCIATFAWVNHEYDLRTAVISTSILATTELFIFYAKIALSDMTFTLFFSLAVFAYFLAIRNQKGWAYVFAGIMLMLAVATKYNGFQPLLIAAVFVPIFHFMSHNPRKRSLRYNASRIGHAILHSLSGLWLSTAPVIAFTILFLALIAEPFRVSDSGAMLGLLRDFIPRFSAGLAYLVRIVYPTKAAVFRIQPFVTTSFYFNVLANFIAGPVLLLSIIGAVKGIAKRNLANILLIIWIAFVFLYFASAPATYARVMLPAVIPIVILSGSGLSWTLSALDRLLRARNLRALSQRQNRTAVKAGLVMAVIAVNLVLAAPAITNTHSAYRAAAEFIAKNVPDGKLVWLKAQPVLIAYMQIMQKHVRFADNITQIDQAYIVVLDFIAQSYPEWPQIQARVSQMQLVFSIRNDVPVVNVLDWTHFSQLGMVTSDPARMSIRIYARVGEMQSASSESFSTLTEIEPAWAIPLCRSFIPSRATWLCSLDSQGVITEIM